MGSRHFFACYGPRNSFFLWKELHVFLSESWNSIYSDLIVLLGPELKLDVKKSQELWTIWCPSPPW